MRFIYIYIQPTRYIQREDRTEENITKEETGLIRQLKKLSANRTKTSIQDVSSVKTLTVIRPFIFHGLAFSSLILSGLESFKI